MAYAYDLIDKNIYENILWLDIKSGEYQYQRIIDYILMFSSDEINNTSNDFKEKMCCNRKKISVYYKCY